jgi:hypothetical protein
VIVVIGDLSLSSARTTPAQAIAVRAAASGSRVEVVAVVADDPEGDQQVLELAASQVGHVAILRGPARPLEPEDVDLALRYLPDVRAIVCVGQPAAILGPAAEQAAWSAATLIVVQARGAAEPEPGEAAVAEGAVVLEAPASDPDGTFAGFVSAFAARLDVGSTPADAWAATTRELAVDPA